MANNISLEDRINFAQAKLNESFGNTSQQEGEDARRFLNKDALSAAYKEDASAKEVIEQFLSITKSIRSMRSSYLPVEFFIKDGSFNADIASETGELESYENTFMRMMGMPSVGSAEFSLSDIDSEIRKSQTLKIIDPDTKASSDVSFEEVKKIILDQRRKARELRRVRIDNSIYNISEDSFIENSFTELAGATISLENLSNEEKANLLGLGFDSDTDQLTGSDGIPIDTPTILQLDDSGTEYFEPNNEIKVSKSVVVSILINDKNKEGNLSKASIEAIETDLWKFSYLLIPPIQDVEIARCINEPDKIVAPPFSNSRARAVNDKKIRPTLLESIIRIRLDKISGTSTFVNANNTTDNGASTQFNASLGSGNSEITDESPDDYGVLESLFILRLRSAISGLANKLFSDVDILINEMKKHRRTPAPEGLETGADIPDKNNSTGNQMKKTESQAEGKISEEPMSNLESQKLIEDSIMFLLGDDSEVLDLQTQTQRNSTIHDAHMMSSLTSIISVPRQRIDSKIDKIIQSRNNGGSGVVGQKTQEIGVVLGTDIGIGTLDVAVFALALFTLNEKSLLGLLSTAQYEKIKNGEFKGLLPEGGDKQDTVIALNELSQLIIDGYNLFIFDLETGNTSG